MRWRHLQWQWQNAGDGLVGMGGMQCAAWRHTPRGVGRGWRVEPCTCFWLAASGRHVCSGPEASDDVRLHENVAARPLHGGPGDGWHANSMKLLGLVQVRPVCASCHPASCLQGLYASPVECTGCRAGLGPPGQWEGRATLEVRHLHFYLHPTALTSG